jgi:1-aminocyclopropane-1-carboxylate deaminase/D-cysteine desulfhydrase-like pyridoxal-dependent ACC family enzyme
MLTGVVSALMVVAGGACAIAGYMVGSWRQRQVMDMDLEGDEVDSRERFLDLVETLREEKSRDNRPN